MSHIKSSDDEESDSSDIILRQTGETTVSNVIPERSRPAYEACYKNFCEWMKASKIKTVTQQVMLNYFLLKSKTRQSTTMWSEYSKLKCMIYSDRNVDISLFAEVSAFLKRKSIGHVAKKSNMLTASDFDRFITEADDREYLMLKAALIIGMAGAFRREELLRLSTKDVVDSGDFLRIKVKDAKTNIPKQFVMTESSVGNCHLMGILRKYMSQRNPTTPHDRFFVGYRLGKCTTQPVGVNTIGAIPKKVATFLGYNDSEMFTGHCFRRSSPKVLADSGAEFSVFEWHDDVEGLRRMIPSYKQQSESNSGGTSSAAKLQLKIEPNPTNERDVFENSDFQQHDDDEDFEDGEVSARQDTDCESKPQIFNINYVVPSNLIIREHQTDQHTAKPGPSLQQSSVAAKVASQTLIDQSTDESDDHMQDDPGEVLPDNGNSYSLSTQEKIDNLRLREMENRVTESALRCKVQKLLVSKAEEEFKHLQEMNRLRLQEANMRLKLLEQNCANEGVSVSNR